jgi:cobalamin biosynthesis protein CobW
MERNEGENATMKIPATVITGFLGAGKTTLVRHLIANAGGQRLALIINEFGDLGVDRELLLGCGVDGCAEGDIVELANGCICCTVADEFLPTIARLLEQPRLPDHIVIETSGLALPKPLIKAFNWPEIRSRVTVDGVIAVVDAPAVAAGRFAEEDNGATAAADSDTARDPGLDHESPLEELFEDQLLCADLVVLNKTDLLDPGTIDSVRDSILGTVRTATNSGAKIVQCVHGRLDPAVVLGLGAAAEDDLAARPSHHDGEDTDHGHDEFASFVLDLGAIADPAALEARLRTVVGAHDVLRVKGFVDVPGKAMRHVVQSVGARVQRYYDRPWRPDEARRSRLVVIGLHDLDQNAVAAALVG